MRTILIIVLILMLLDEFLKPSLAAMYLLGYTVYAATIDLLSLLRRKN